MFLIFRLNFKVFKSICRTDKSIYKIAYYKLLKHVIQALIAFWLVIMLLKHGLNMHIVLADFWLGYAISLYLIVKNTVVESIEEYLDIKKPHE